MSESSRGVFIKVFFSPLAFEYYKKKKLLKTTKKWRAMMEERILVFLLGAFGILNFVTIRTRENGRQTINENGNGLLLFGPLFDCKLGRAV